MEHHPRLDRQNLMIPHPRIILGSFPIWSLTDHEDAETSQGQSEEVKNEGEFPFFYGSSTNLLWKWYRQYLDPEITLLDVPSIQRSLDRNKIGITDVILSCKRNGKSSLDKDLSQRLYNHHFFSYPQPGEILKILCTSKGVMNEMLLHSNFFKEHPRITLDALKSQLFQDKFIQKINGRSEILRKPIFLELKIEDGGVIQCLSTPSPGSPYRRLIDFGIASNNLDGYLSAYLSATFNWFSF